MTDLLLINPSWGYKKGNIWKKVSSCMPPLGLASIGAYLEEKGFKVKIIDMQAERLLPEELPLAINGETPSFIGITATTITIDNAYTIAKILKGLLSDSKIILGGVHPTVLPDEALESPNIDYCIRGEGEETLLDLMEGKDPKNIPGLSYRSDGRIIHNPFRPPILDLDTLPSPAYHLLPMNRYYPALGSYKRLPVISIMATRGCPGRCTFCYGDMLGKRIRYRSPSRLIKEIKYLMETHGIKEIQFYDDTFTAIQKNVREFSSLILKEKINLSWSCFARVDTVDLETLRLMKEAGCHQIMYGLESGDEEILKNINKGTALDQAREAVKLTKEVGIDVRAAFMLGNPGETEESIQRTIQFALDLDPELCIFNITTPYPGTEMFKWAKENGYLSTEDWTKYDLSHMVMDLPTIASTRIEEYYHRVYRLFYLRPSYILRKIFKISSLEGLQVNLRSLLGMLKKA